MKSILAAAAMTAGILAAAQPVMAAPKPIERVTGAQGALILRGAIVPAGNDIFYLSGQLADPIDPAKRATIADFGDTKTQTISTLKKIKALLEEKGYKMSDVFKLTVFVAGDPSLGGKMDFAGLNEGFKQFFGSADNPNTVARSALQVAALAGPNYLVEIEAIAAKAPAGR